MKRIVRLTESDLVKLVKRVISEQSVPSGQTNYKSIVQGGVPQQQTPSQGGLGKSAEKVYTKTLPQGQKTGINFYDDVTEKKLFKSYQSNPLPNVPRTKGTDKIVPIEFFNTKDFFDYSCTNKVFYPRGLGANLIGKHNKGYSDYLQKNYCPKTTTSRGGTTVPNVKWAQTNQSGNSNVA